LDQEVRERRSAQVAARRALIGGGQVAIEGGRFLQLPGVINLEPEAESFLHNAKLALADVGRLCGPLHGKKFDDKCQKARSWLKSSYGDNDLVIKNRHAIQSEPLVIANPAWALGKDDLTDLLEDTNNLRLARSH
jgi:hypothetical protein